MTTMYEHLRQWMKENRLLNLQIVKVKEGKQEIWGRLIQFTEDKGDLLIYNDDSKTLINVNINEIEEINPASKK